jgi:hypothetical protein
MIQPIQATIAPHSGLMLGLPFSGKPIPPEFALTLSAQIWPSNFRVSKCAIKGKPVDEARQEMAELAIKEHAKYLAFADEDLSLMPHTYRTLLATLAQADEETMVCAGIYTSKSDPAEPLVYRGESGQGPFWRWKMGDVFEVDGIATGMMLINVKVFEYLEKPWFKTTDDRSANVHQTEDLYFCEKVRAAGFKILADSNVMGVHWGWDGQQFIPYYLSDDSYPMRPRVEQTEGIAV